MLLHACCSKVLCQRTLGSGGNIYVMASKKATQNRIILPFKALLKRVYVRFCVT